MQSLAEVSVLFADPEARNAVKEAVEKEAVQTQIDQIVASIPDEQLDAAIEKVSAHNKARAEDERIVKIASDYWAGGQIFAESFKEAGFSPERLVAIDEKVDRIIDFFKKAGAEI